MNVNTSLIAHQERSFVPKEFKLSSWEALEPFYVDLGERELSTQELFEEWIKDWDELYAVVSEDMRWKYIKTSIDTSDAEAKAALEDFYVNLDPRMKPWENKLQKKFNASGLKENLAAEFINFKRGIANDLALFNEKNIELSKELSLLENKYAEITGAWTINYKDQELTMPQAAKFMRDTDRSVREAVYMLSRDREFQDAATLDQLLSDLIAKRHQIALNAGYSNYRDYKFDEMHRFDYTAKDCEAFHKSTASAILPLLKVIDTQRKADLKVENLKPWDMSVDPLQREPLQPFKTTSEFVDRTVDCFNKLDPYFGACIANMFETNRLDLESRKGKAPGGYMMAMPESGVPFIFMNHASAEGDVRVMVHEGGHAIHSYLAHALKYASMRQTPSEVAELASMSMELFSLENWESFYANTEDLNRAKKSHLEGLLKILPSVAKGDAFQHWMYANPTHSIADRHAKWTALNKIYGSGAVDSSGLENYAEIGYQGILHFYQVPFYYIEYGFAQLGAIAMWMNFKKDAKKAVKDYSNALRLGYTTTIPEIYKTAGIKFDFSEEYVRDLASFVKIELEKL